MSKLILTKLGIKTIAETLGWGVEFNTQDKEKYATFSQYSPLGEDFSFDVWYERISEIPEKVKEYWEDFDANEHAMFWVENKNVPGTPQSVSELVEDANAIDEMLSTLAGCLEQGYIKEAE